jgi:hypothetical protein
VNRTDLPELLVLAALIALGVALALYGGVPTVP